MSQNYRLKVQQNDPEITLALPASMVNDLCDRAEENGRTLNVEFLMRLARTLEYDVDMEVSDNYMGIDCLNPLLLKEG